MAEQKSARGSRVGQRPGIASLRVEPPPRASTFSGRAGVTSNALQQWSGRRDGVPVG